MNIIVVDTSTGTRSVGDERTPTDLTTYEGVVAHELEHLLHNYSDPGELSWVDEGLADFAIFLNGYRRRRLAPRPTTRSSTARRR